MKYVLDTSVYLGATRSEETRERFRLIRRHADFSLRVLGAHLTASG